MKTVKFTFPYPEFPILRQTPASSGVWGDYKFIINEEPDTADYWVVFGYLGQNDSVKCFRENTFFLTGEPDSIDYYDDKFVDQFNYLITCQKRIKHRNPIYFLQGHPWHVGKNYDELSDLPKLEKTKTISVITSNKAFTEGHRRRLDFVMRLKERFKDKIDLYGRGINDFADKWDVLAPYKYSVAIENYVAEDWVTEKLYDCYLAQTVPIYYGAPNVEKYFPSESLIKVDIDDFEGSAQAIERVLDEDVYERSFNALKVAADKYLNEYNIFAMMVNFFEKFKPNSNDKEKVYLYGEKHFRIPRVSVIMPVFNGEKYLRESINSVLEQTYDDIELIIINDGSTDKSENIILEYKDPRIVYLKNEKNLKLVSTLNRALSVARGEFIARMDCDDVALPERIEKQVTYMDNHQYVGVCGTWFELMDDKHTVRKHPESNKEIKEALLHIGSVIAHPTAMMRKSVLTEHSIQYDISYIQGEDYKMWADLGKVSELGNVPEVLLKYRVHENQLTQTERPDFAYYSQKVKAQLVTYAGGTYRREDMYLLEALFLEQYPTTISGIKKLSRLLGKLINQNRSSGYYQDINFENLLVTLFYKCCLMKLHMGFPAISVFGSFLLRANKFGKCGLLLKLSYKYFHEKARIIKKKYYETGNSPSGVIMKIHGDTASQLFQYFTGLTISKRYNLPLLLDISGYELFKRFEFSLSKILRPDIRIANGEEISRFIEDGMINEESPNEVVNIESKMRLYLSGYWRDNRYFSEVDTEIREVFSAEFLPELVNSIKDYALLDLTHLDYHAYSELEKYIAEAVLKAEKNQRWIVLTDGVLPKLPGIKYSEMKLTEDNELSLLALGVKSKFTVIQNTSFGWWLGKITDLNGGKVVVPRNWFDISGREVTNIPDSWERL